MAHYIELLEKINLVISNFPIVVSVIQVGLVNASSFFHFFFGGKCEKEVMKKINYILSLVNFHGETLMTIHIAGHIA